MCSVPQVRRTYRARSSKSSMPLPTRSSTARSTMADIFAAWPVNRWADSATPGGTVTALRRWSCARPGPRPRHCPPIDSSIPRCRPGMGPDVVGATSAPSGRSIATRRRVWVSAPGVVRAMVSRAWRARSGSVAATASAPWAWTTTTLIWYTTRHFTHRSPRCAPARPRWHGPRAGFRLVGPLGGAPPDPHVEDVPVHPHEGTRRGRRTRRAGHWRAPDRPAPRPSASRRPTGPNAIAARQASGAISVAARATR